MGLLMISSGVLAMYLDALIERWEVRSAVRYRTSTIWNWWWPIGVAGLVVALLGIFVLLLPVVK
jgi:ABC-type uncharacterized transport system permease subunit